MKIFFLKVLMWIQVGISRLTDDVFNLFTVFAGIEEVAVKEGEATVQKSLLMAFIDNATVQRVFWSLLVVGVVCTLILTVVSVMKNMVTIKKSVAKIMGQMAMSIVSMIIVVAGLFATIFGANVILGGVQEAFGQDGKLSVGQQLLQSAVGDAWLTVEEPTGIEGESINRPANIGDLFGYELDAYGNKLLDGEGNPIIKKDWKGITPDKIFGVAERSVFEIFENEEDYETHTWKDGCAAYADINEYNFFIGVPSVIILAVTVFIAAMGLVVRLYDLVFMMLCSPLVMATLPVDDGAKFKLWRETAISKTLLAYGSVFAINIYLIILPLINRITIPLHPSLTTLARVLLIICGALTISNGQVLFARLMGTSAEESRQATHGMRAMFAAAAGTYGAVKSAGRLTFGVANGAGGRQGGLLNRSKLVLGGTTNAAGTVLTGKRNTTGRVTTFTQTKIDNLRKRWENKGGILGYGKHGKKHNNEN